MTIELKTYKCKFCGDTFQLDPDEQELYDEGFMEIDPECCDDCMVGQSFGAPDEFDSHPGL